MGWQLQTHKSAEIIFIYKFAGKSPRCKFLSKMLQVLFKWCIHAKDKSGDSCYLHEHKEMPFLV